MVVTRKRVHIIFQVVPDIIQYDEIISHQICHQQKNIQPPNISLFRWWSFFFPLLLLTISAQDTTFLIFHIEWTVISQVSFNFLTMCIIINIYLCIVHFENFGKKNQITSDSKMLSGSSYFEKPNPTDLVKNYHSK